MLAIWAICALDERTSILVRDKPIFSPERKLHKDYCRKGSVEKELSGRGSQGAWRQDELIGAKPPVVIILDFDFIKMEVIVSLTMISILTLTTIAVK
jgi:hypothetical protein